MSDNTDGKRSVGRPRRSQQGQVNQQVLAERLNLSQTTVSRALAHHVSINAETKAMVWDLAAQLGYSLSTPTRAGSKKSGAENMVIGVIISIPKKHRGRTETSQIILRGIAERSTHHRVTIDILYHEPAEDETKTVLKRIRQNRWKGCIMVYPMTDDLVKALATTVPCVSVVDNYRLGYIDSVDSDQIDAISGLVKTLYAKGHRKLGFASWVYDVPTPWVFQRFGAYVHTLFQLELEFDPTSVLNLRRSEAKTPDQVADLMVASIRRGTSAFLFAADHQAYQILPLLTARGIRIPEDCSLTGFDGIAPPDGLKQIATVKVPYDEIGRSAFHQLMHRISFPTSPRRHVLVDADLELGNSIAEIAVQD